MTRHPGTDNLRDSRQRSVIFALLAGVLGALAGSAAARVEPVLVLAGVTAAIVAGVVLVRPFVGLLIYMALFFLRPGELYPVLAPLRLERVVGLLALFALAFQQYRMYGIMRVDWSRQTQLLLAFTAVALLSVTTAYWRANAVETFAELLKIVVLYVLIVGLLTSKVRIRVFVASYLSLVCYIAATSFRAYLGGDYAVAQGIDRAVGQTDAGGNANKLAALCAYNVPILLLFLIRARYAWHKLLMLAPLALLVVTMSVTGSRAALTGLIAGLVVLWAQSSRKLAAAVIGVALLVGAYALLPDQYQHRYAFVTQEIDGSSQGRLDAWKVGVEMMIDRPFLGVGLGCFGSARAGNYSPESRRSFLRSHSLYVQVPAETGLFGGAIYLAFLVCTLKTCLTVKRSLKDEDAWQVEKTLTEAILASLIAYMVGSAFGDTLLRRPLYVYGAVNLAVLRTHVAAEHQKTVMQPADRFDHRSEVRTPIPHKSTVTT